MKILHITTNTSGGAGIAACRLHKGLLKSGLDSKLLTRGNPRESGSAFQFYEERKGIPRRLKNKFLNMMINKEREIQFRNRPSGLEIFTDVRTTTFLKDHPLVREADIIHLHWVANFFDFSNFFSGIQQKPIVWTLHDMNPFTGGCHYSGDCRKYEQLCNACPQLGSKAYRDLSFKIFNWKQSSYDGININPVAPSHWLANCAIKSKLFEGMPVEVIGNGVPTRIFQAQDKKLCRKILGLPPDKTIIMFGAEDVSNKRKGIAYLMQTLDILRQKRDVTDLCLAMFGSDSNLRLTEIGIPAYSIGNIDDERFMSVCYNAADIFVVPSLEDNLPNTILESMSCGTTVVGFDVGGIAEMVRSGETGLLVKSRDANDLANKIWHLVNSPEDRERFGINARTLIENEFSLERQSEKYHYLYRRLIER